MDITNVTIGGLEFQVEYYFEIPALDGAFDFVFGRKSTPPAPYVAIVEILLDKTGEDWTHLLSDEAKKQIKDQIENQKT